MDLVPAFTKAAGDMGKANRQRFFFFGIHTHYRHPSPSTTAHPHHLHTQPPTPPLFFFSGFDCSWSRFVSMRSILYPRSRQPRVTRANRTDSRHGFFFWCHHPPPPTSNTSTPSHGPPFFFCRGLIIYGIFSFLEDRFCTRRHGNRMRHGQREPPYFFFFRGGGGVGFFH